MVKDTCLQTGFVLEYQTLGPEGSRTPHYVNIQQTLPIKQNKNSTLNSIKT